MADERIPWKYTADYYESCNCAYGCPCNFNGFPTKGFCRGVIAMRIREGTHGETDLSGAQFAFAVEWPKAIHDGNGTAALWFDESVSEAQQQALGRILTGEDGGLPHEILATTLSNILGPFVSKVDVNWNETDSSVRIGDQVVSEMETFKDPVSGEPHEVHVVIPDGFIWKDAKTSNVKRLNVNVDGLSFSEENTNGFYAVVTHTNQS
jgi:hypothetical protein